MIRPLPSADRQARFRLKTRRNRPGVAVYGYRYYDPVTGRWPSRDAIEEVGGLNLYGFIRNSATSRIDILGLSEGKVDCEKLRKMIDQLDAAYDEIMDELAELADDIESARTTSWLSLASKVVPAIISGGASLASNVSKSSLIGVSAGPGYIPTLVSNGGNIAPVGSAYASRMLAQSNSARNIGAAGVGASSVGQLLADNGAGRLGRNISDVLAPLDRLFDDQIDGIEKGSEQASDTAKANRDLKEKLDDEFKKCCK